VNVRDRIISLLDTHPQLLTVAEPLIERIFALIKAGKARRITEALDRAHAQVDEMAAARRPDAHPPGSSQPE